MTERILEAARRLGYRADFASQSLARRSPRTIGVYVPPDPWAGIGMSYESKILQGIERSCHRRGYDLLVINLGGNASPEICGHRFTERRIDGLILLHVSDDAAWLSPLLDEDDRVVAVNYYGPEARLRRVNFDDRAATALAVEHLVHMGHERIAYAGIMSARPGPGAVLRREGFEQSTRQAGLVPHERWIMDRTRPFGDWPTEALDHAASGAYVADRLLEMSGPRPTALVCYGDLVAVGAIRRLKNHGIRIPQDISVTGIDDMDICPYIDPPLTTIRQPLDDMGEQAAEMLFEKMGKDSRKNSAAAHLSRPTFVPRQSTAAPRSTQEKPPRAEAASHERAAASRT